MTVKAVSFVERNDAAEVADLIEGIPDLTASGFELQVRSKIWLEVNGEPVFGRGRDELLRLIRKTGSINAAAKEMNIPYRKAWTYIDAMEKRLGFPLVTRLKGGTGGGESSLTPQAMEMLENFTILQQGIQELVDKKFKELF